ncbi:MAG: hypothetical protein MAG551_01172 [Candidatus Scalindua arabica]|uniref:Uncharacterized protein n=1 Tax=Candidatus Scalindua arabica TaxID=1127984 RepID=A0A942A3W4_9BACT|nr:hypothetical protein [Candidatus Scalindua arabica]
MIWNIGLHIIAGLFGTKIFVWTVTGILTCVAITCFVQSIDMLRIYRTTMTRINQQPPHIKDEQIKAFKQRLPIAFPQLFIMKVIGYGLVTLISASVFRAM